MPTTLESAIVLLALLAPGFIAMRVKNSVLPYHPPSAFQEAIEAAVISAFLLPLWLIFGWRFLNARHHLITTAETLAPLDPWVFLPVLGILGLVYLVVSPLLGIFYGFIQVQQPYATLARKVLRGRFDRTVQPEVWDRVFDRELSPWVRVVFRNGAAVQGVARSAGVSPSARQLCLAPLDGVPESLVRLDSEGRLLEDLSERAGEGIWLDIGSEVLYVEVFG